ncbi:tdc operon transcriptional activator [Escherichia coli]|uniref:Tdc operon transcriptional activator n=1 Tax=Escherichia coli TaxID=562 RepID=A0A377C4K4_ECOLX|nr:tdc operon transcriptional activator [Escherichia coli]
MTIYNLVLNADFLTVIPCDMTSPFGSNQFITIPVEETLPVAQYAAVWSKNYRIKKAASVLVELAKEGNDSNLLIVFYVQIMPDDFVMQLHRF